MISGGFSKAVFAAIRTATASTKGLQVIVTKASRVCPFSGLVLLATIAASLQ
jgi:hypothetical protein